MPWGKGKMQCIKTHSEMYNKMHVNVTDGWIWIWIESESELILKPDVSSSWRQRHVASNFLTALMPPPIPGVTFGEWGFSFLFFFLIFIFTLLYFTILYWFCHTLTWIHHGTEWSLRKDLWHLNNKAPFFKPLGKQPISSIMPLPIYPLIPLYLHLSKNWFLLFTHPFF